MAIFTDAKSLTVRLRPDVYEAATHIARKSGHSLNYLVQQGLETLIKAEEEREMVEAATLLGIDAAESSVEFALASQAEVALHHAP
ncbi:MAG: hypothetical protein NT023_17770 [Armatimonadetes bacterium]|nr:hypothetical protein [Armatimonadota bacterium]